MTNSVMAENIVAVQRSLRSPLDKFYKYDVKMKIDGDDRIGIVSSMKNMLGNADAGVKRVATA